MQQVHNYITKLNAINHIFCGLFEFETLFYMWPDNLKNLMILKDVADSELISYFIHTILPGCIPLFSKLTCFFLSVSFNLGSCFSFEEEKKKKLYVVWTPHMVYNFKIKIGNQ